MTSFLSADGLEISYQLHGEGKPLILLHGFISSFQVNWVDTGWLDFLTQRSFHVIGLDFRGHGLSEKPHHPEAYSTALMSADVLLMMDRLNTPQADILGFSMGGGVALHMGMYHPERCGKIAVGGVGDPAILGHHDPQKLEQITKALKSDDPQSIPSSIGRKFRLFAESTSNDLKALAAMTRSLSWPGHLERIAPIRSSVLVVAAEHDQFMSGTEELQAGIPHGQFVTLSDATHSSVLRDPRFKALVLDFLIFSTV
jgi:pimeloyl-ACP methyl ester carboxylesterase